MCLSGLRDSGRLREWCLHFCVWNDFAPSGNLGCVLGRDRTSVLPWKIWKAAAGFSVYDLEQAILKLHSSKKLEIMTRCICTWEAFSSTAHATGMLLMKETSSSLIRDEWFPSRLLSSQPSSLPCSVLSCCHLLYYTCFWHKIDHQPTEARDQSPLSSVYRHMKVFPKPLFHSWMNVCRNM